MAISQLHLNARHRARVFLKCAGFYPSPFCRATEPDVIPSEARDLLFRHRAATQLHRLNFQLLTSDFFSANLLTDAPQQRTRRPAPNSQTPQLVCRILRIPAKRLLRPHRPQQHSPVHRSHCLRVRPRRSQTRRKDALRRNSHPHDALRPRWFCREFSRTLASLAFTPSFLFRLAAEAHLPTKTPLRNLSTSSFRSHSPLVSRGILGPPETLRRPLIACEGAVLS